METFTLFFSDKYFTGEPLQRNMETYSTNKWQNSKVKFYNNTVIYRALELRSRIMGWIRKVGISTFALSS